MADPVECPAGVWTEIAPIAFEQIMLQWGDGSLRIEMAPTKPLPSNTTAGIVVRAEALKTTQWGLWPLRTGQATNAAFARPAGDEKSITVSRNF